MCVYVHLHVYRYTCTHAHLLHLLRACAHTCSLSLVLAGDCIKTSSYCLSFIQSPLFRPCGRLCSTVGSCCLSVTEFSLRTLCGSFGSTAGSFCLSVTKFPLRTACGRLGSTEGSFCLSGTEFLAFSLSGSLFITFLGFSLCTLHSAYNNMKIGDHKAHHVDDRKYVPEINVLFLFSTPTLLCAARDSVVNVLIGYSEVAGTALDKLSQLQGGFSSSFRHSVCDKSHFAASII